MLRYTCSRCGYTLLAIKRTSELRAGLPSPAAFDRCPRCGARLAKKVIRVEIRGRSNH